MYVGLLFLVVFHLWFRYILYTSKNLPAQLCGPSAGSWETTAPWVEALPHPPIDWNTLHRYTTFLCDSATSLWPKKNKNKKLRWLKHFMHGRLHCIPVLICRHSLISTKACELKHITHTHGYTIFLYHSISSLLSWQLKHVTYAWLHHIPVQFCLQSLISAKPL